MLRKLSVKAQMWLLLSVPCVALLLVIAVAMVTAQQLYGHTEQMYKNTAKPMRAMAEVASRIPRMRVGLDLILLQETPLKDDKGVVTRIKEAREEDIPAMRKAMQLAVEAQVDEAARQQAQTLQQQFDNMEKSSLQPMLAAFEANNFDEARRIYAGPYTDSYRAMREGTNKLLDALEKQAGDGYADSAKAYDQSTVIKLATSLGALLLSLLLGVAIVRYLEKRVSSLQHDMSTAADQLALNRRSELTGRDELARIATSYNRLMDSLRHAISGVQQFTGEVGHTASQVAGTAGNVTASSSIQSQSAQAVAAAVEQVAVSVQHVADSTATTAQLSEALQQRANQGLQVLGETSGSIRQVSDSLQLTTGQTRALAKSSENIRDIVDAIRDIADQTNLLALNAAIEAARAGEMGRGFAVVADEVRKLAERTSQATNEVGQLLSGIHQQVDVVVSEVNASAERAQQGLGLVLQAEQTIQEISRDASGAAISIREIAEATREQGKAAESIAHNIEQIVQMAEQNHSEAERAQQDSSRLQDMARQLQQEVTRFAV